jgi:hypothetical protein
MLRDATMRGDAPFALTLLHLLAGWPHVLPGIFSCIPE